MRTLYHIYLVIGITLLLSACMVGPDYRRPTAVVPTQYKEAKGKKTIVSANTARYKDWKIAEPRDDAPRGEWWKIFNDPILNQLEEQLMLANQTIINADANYRQARALVDEARAGFFPIVTGSVTVTRQRRGQGSTEFVSAGGSSSSGTAVTGGGSRLSTTNTLFLEASWEPDIWGSVRRAVEASQAGAEANAALLGATQLSAQATLAQTYFELRGIDADQKLLNDTVTSYKKALKLTQHQYAAGVASRADVVQAQSQLEAAQAQAINNGIARAQYEHAIAVLVGVPPADFSLSPRPFKATPPPIPLTVPSMLLERRPDIAQAERLMAQANAEIGVAIATYFPALTLTGNASSTGQNLGHWISLPAIGWAYGPQLAETIFDGGLRQATVTAARANYDATVATYRQTVLAAFQEVEDNLAALRILGAEAAVQKQAVNSAQQALKIIVNQYKAGTTDYTSVMLAQTVAFAAEKNWVDVEYARMTAAVGLIKSLGGGWNQS
ncbi:MAG TPA: efflux transporter outer membrane subunit [Gammaproteobacteria bacterium]|jgi:NodT family efflux transporter outer membrane factor (OMF) lipoprotein|nr:efflux transporter outer membrane subunit [Gammaproteobacteria bacterium]